MTSHQQSRHWSHTTAKHYRRYTENYALNASMRMDSTSTRSWL